MSNHLKQARIAFATALVSGLCLSALPGTALAQTASPAGVSTPGFQSKPLLVSPMSGNDQKEVVLVTATIAPGASSPRHTHPGDCYGTVVEGAIELHAEGKETRRITVGEAFSNGRGTVHQFVNVSDAPVRIVTTLLVDKDKPRTTFLPASQ